MTRFFSGASAAIGLIAVSLACGGCGDDPDTGQSGPGSGAPGNQPVTTPGIKQIMGKLTKGPNSLTEVIGKELSEPQPAWETIQGQTKEYVQLAGDMAKYDPPKGTKESWKERTAAYAESAADLDRAAQAKDKSAAMTAHGEIKNSCMGCHRQHRMMGPGGSGPGGFGPRGFGGPPPGGPGAPPPSGGAGPR
jgi:hypothetical protein